MVNFTWACTNFRVDKNCHLIFHFLVHKVHACIRNAEWGGGRDVYLPFATGLIQFCPGRILLWAVSIFIKCLLRMMCYCWGRSNVIDFHHSNRFLKTCYVTVMLQKLFHVQWLTPKTVPIAYKSKNHWELSRRLNEFPR